MNLMNEIKRAKLVITMMDGRRQEVVFETDAIGPVMASLNLEAEAVEVPPSATSDRMYREFTSGRKTGKVVITGAVRRARTRKPKESKS
jgi:hypothetical protein